MKKLSGLFNSKNMANFWSSFLGYFIKHDFYYNLPVAVVDVITLAVVVSIESNTGSIRLSVVVVVEMTSDTNKE